MNADTESSSPACASPSSSDGASPLTSPKMPIAQPLFAGAAAHLQQLHAPILYGGAPGPSETMFVFHGAAGVGQPTTAGKRRVTTTSGLFDALGVPGHENISSIDPDLPPSETFRNPMSPLSTLRTTHSPPQLSLSEIKDAASRIATRPKTNVRHTSDDYKPVRPETVLNPRGDEHIDRLDRWAFLLVGINEAARQTTNLPQLSPDDPRWLSDVVIGDLSVEVPYLVQYLMARKDKELEEAEKARHAEEEKNRPDAIDFEIAHTETTGSTRITGSFKIECSDVTFVIVSFILVCSAMIVLEWMATRLAGLRIWNMFPQD